jgi:NAD-dependent SIR2 family protein deacetylase
MSKLGLFATLTSILGALTFATLSASAEPAATATACVHNEFKTELVKQACEKGGQKQAKDVMKAFMKEKKIKSCNQCHSKLAPKYELKADALEQFKKAGGK